MSSLTEDLRHQARAFRDKALAHAKSMLSAQVAPYAAERGQPVDDWLDDELRVGIWYVDHTQEEYKYVVIEPESKPSVTLRVPLGQGTIGFIVAQHERNTGGPLCSADLVGATFEDLRGRASIEDERLGHDNVICFPTCVEAATRRVDFVVSTFLCQKNVFTPEFAESLIPLAELTCGRCSLLHERWLHHAVIETLSRTPTFTAANLQDQVYTALEGVVIKRPPALGGGPELGMFTWSAVLDTDPTGTSPRMQSKVDVGQLRRLKADLYGNSVDEHHSTTVFLSDCSWRTGLRTCGIVLRCGDVEVGTLRLHFPDTLDISAPPATTSAFDRVLSDISARVGKFRHPTTLSDAKRAWEEENSLMEAVLGSILRPDQVAMAEVAPLVYGILAWLSPSVLRDQIVAASYSQTRTRVQRSGDFAALEDDIVAVERVLTLLSATTPTPTNFKLFRNADDRALLVQGDPDGMYLRMHRQDVVSIEGVRTGDRFAVTILGKTTGVVFSSSFDFDVVHNGMIEVYTCHADRLTNHLAAMRTRAAGAVSAALSTGAAAMWERLHPDSRLPTSGDDVEIDVRRNRTISVVGRTIRELSGGAGEDAIRSHLRALGVHFGVDVLALLYSLGGEEVEVLDRLWAIPVIVLGCPYFWVFVGVARPREERQENAIRLALADLKVAVRRIEVAAERAMLLTTFYDDLQRRDLGHAVRTPLAAATDRIEHLLYQLETKGHNDPDEQATTRVLDGLSAAVAFVGDYDDDPTYVDVRSLLRDVVKRSQLRMLSRDRSASLFGEIEVVVSLLPAFSLDPRRVSDSAAMRLLRGALIDIITNAASHSTRCPAITWDPHAVLIVANSVREGEEHRARARRAATHIGRALSLTVAPPVARGRGVENLVSACRRLRLRVDATFKEDKGEFHAAIHLGPWLTTSRDLR